MKTWRIQIWFDEQPLLDGSYIIQDKYSPRLDVMAPYVGESSVNAQYPSRVRVVVQESNVPE